MLTDSAWTTSGRGGEISFDQPMPNHPSRIGRLERGEIDAIFDEGVVLWADRVAAAGAKFLPLGPHQLEGLQAQRFRRGLIEKTRYPLLPRDVPTVDYSGLPIYCRTDTPDALVEQFCQALVSRREDIVWDIGDVRQPPLPLERMVKESPMTPSTSQCTPCCRRLATVRLPPVSPAEPVGPGHRVIRKRRSTRRSYAGALSTRRQIG